MFPTSRLPGKYLLPIYDSQDGAMSRNRHDRERKGRKVVTRCRRSYHAKIICSFSWATFELSIPWPTYTLLSIDGTKSWFLWPKQTKSLFHLVSFVCFRGGTSPIWQLSSDITVNFRSSSNLPFIMYEASILIQWISYLWCHVSNVILLMSTQKWLQKVITLRK